MGAACVVGVAAGARPVVDWADGLSEESAEGSLFLRRRILTVHELRESSPSAASAIRHQPPNADRRVAVRIPLTSSNSPSRSHYPVAL